MGEIWHVNIRYSYMSRCVTVLVVRCMTSYVNSLSYLLHYVVRISTIIAEHEKVVVSTGTTNVTQCTYNRINQSSFNLKKKSIFHSSMSFMQSGIGRECWIWFYSFYQEHNIHATCDLYFQLPPGKNVSKQPPQWLIENVEFRC